MTVLVVQARMASTRLPGKVLRRLGDRSVLAWVVRAATASGAGDVVVATGDDGENDPIAREAEALGVAVHRGSESDVLARFVGALDGRPDDEVVVRLTADCPLLDPAVIADAVRAFEATDVDYLSTVLEPTLPRGTEVEVTRAGRLRAIERVATGVDRIHVTSALYRAGDRPTKALTFEPRSSDLRVTLDTPEDAALLDAVVAELGDGPHRWQDVAALLRARPDLVAINADVRQKPIDAG